MQSKRSFKAELVILFGFFIMFISTSLKGVYQVYFSELTNYYHVDIAQLAFAGGMFGLTQGLFSALAGKISDRYGAPYVLITGTFVASIAFAIFAFDNNFISFCAVISICNFCIDFCSSKYIDRQLCYFF